MKILSLGLESISFQSGEFHRELTDIITEARKGPVNKQTKEEVGKKIALCTAKHTNIQTTVEFVDNFNNACIYPSFFSPENVLYSKDARSFFKQYYDYLAATRPGTTVEGWINTAKGTVGGHFAKLTHATYYDTDFIFGNKKFSAEGAASIVLHEIGHGFTFFQFMADTVMLNVVLQQTYQELVKAANPGEVKMIVTRNRKRLKLQNASDWSEEVYSKDKETIIKVLAAEAVIERQKSDNKVFYTQDIAEELAEIYCVRQGGAKGLIEVRQYFANRTDLRNASFGILSSALVAAGAGLCAALVPALAWILVPVAVGGALFAGLGILSAASFPEFTKFSQTIGKIRNQMVERLKEGNLPPQLLKETLETIDMAIKAVEETPDDATPMAVAFFDFFRKEKRNSVAWREYTDKLENMATNDLFIRAARLSLGSTTA